MPPILCCAPATAGHRGHIMTTKNAETVYSMSVKQHFQLTRRLITATQVACRHWSGSYSISIRSGITQTFWSPEERPECRERGRSVVTYLSPSLAILQNLVSLSYHCWRYVRVSAGVPFRTVGGHGRPKKTCCSLDE